MKNIILKSILVVVILTTFNSCWFDKSEPNVVFMPNMYYSEAYEAYSMGEDMNKNGEALKYSALVPVKGTVARGHSEYNFENTTEGYQAAKTQLASPLVVTDAEADLTKGKYLYNMYCAVCHGDDGDGQGILVQHEKILGVPNYKDRDLTEGSIYHVIMNGKGIMGSHASQLNEKERWQVVKYVQNLRK